MVKANIQTIFLVSITFHFGHKESRNNIFLFTLLRHVDDFLFKEII